MYSRLIKREVVLRPTEDDNSYRIRNEHLPQSNGEVTRLNGTPPNFLTAQVHQGLRLSPFRFSIEEDALLPLAMGVSRSSPDYSKKRDTFLRDILIKVQEGRTLNLSIELHGGVIDDVEALKFLGEKEVINCNVETFNTYCNYTLKDKKVDAINRNSELLIRKLSRQHLFGTHVNIVDFWIYRFALESKQVSNSLAIYNRIKGSKNKVKFYIFDKEEQLEHVSDNNTLILNATKALGLLVSDKNKVEAVLREFENNKSYKGYQLPQMFLFKELGEAERIAMIIEISKQFPQAIIDLEADSNLSHRAIINKALLAGILTTIEGSSTIYLDNEELGNNVDAVVNRLLKQGDILDSIQARLRKSQLESGYEETEYSEMLLDKGNSNTGSTVTVDTLD